MREILFRGKRVDNGEWEYGNYIKGYEHCTSPHAPINYEVHYINVQNKETGRFYEALVSSETVGQYTGLKDKNGKKIFEGDIVVTRFTTGQICAIGDIQFACGVYGVEWTANKKNKEMIGCFGQAHNLRKLDDDIINRIEVIGNIHDNPELLQE